MDIVDVRDFLITLPMVEECQPFGDDCAVYKIGGKVFACISFAHPDVIALKCDPERAILLREKHQAITPAWHWNKKHWNDLQMSSLNDKTIIREIRHSYVTVINKNVTPKALRLELQAIASGANIHDTNKI